MMDHRSGGICRVCEEPDDIAEKLRMELGIKLINDPQTPLLQGHRCLVLLMNDEHVHVLFTEPGTNGR